ncbi:MAG TPA: hypothetical protein VK120_03010 [Sporosarcina sp.]|nr:hypothetical protein [Sporosarcina sp.]
MKASTFFVGLATGAIAAAVTVLYSTPKSGSDMRSTVKTDWQEAVQDLSRQLNKLKGSFAKFADEAEEHVPDAVDYVKDSFEHLQDVPKATRKKLERELADIQKSLAKLEQSIVTE